MHVTVFTKTSSIGPSSRYRYEQYREQLETEDVRLDTRPLFGRLYFRLTRVRPRPLRILLKAFYVPWRFLHRCLQLAFLRSTDLVVVEHQLFPYLPATAERWLAARTVPWILEFDDAIYLTRLHRRKMEVLCALADRVVVGNRHLAEFARRFNDAISIVPTTIDLSRYGTGQRPASRAGSPLVVGWIGLPYNFGSLELLREPLRRISRETPLVLRVVSAGELRLDGVQTEHVDWSMEREVDEISQFDIGVMPLEDSEWSRGKCGLKILQYFAAGVPVVASPSGVNSDIIHHGMTGLLAANEAMWIESLGQLAADRALRERLGQAGRHTVEEEFSMTKWAPRIAAIWRDTAEGATP